MYPLLLAAAMTMASTPMPQALPAWSRSGYEMPLQQARDKFDAVEKLDSVTSRYSSLDPKAKVLIVEGDLSVDGPLQCDRNLGHGAAGLIVTGSLTVRGPIVNADANGGPFLLVLGTTRAQAIVAGGAELMFVGDAVVDDIVVGEYNDGILRFGGSLTVPVAITNDHDFSVAGGVRGRWLDPFNEGHSWTSVLHPQLPVEKDEEGGEEFDVMGQLVPRLLAGKPVLRADLPPAEEFPESWE